MDNSGILIFGIDLSTILAIYFAIWFIIAMTLLLIVFIREIFFNSKLF